MLLAGLLLLSGCGGGENRGAEPEKEPSVFRTAEVRRSTARRSEPVVSTITSEREAVISAQITGPIQQLPVTLGDTVQAGELLVKLNETEIRTRLNQMDAQLKHAERERDRVEALMRQNASNQREMDAAEAEYAIAKAQVAEVQTILEYTSIRAPFDGVITRKHVNQGDLATPGKPLLVLEDPNSLQAEAEVPEALLKYISPGMELSVVIASTETTLTGKVTEISPAANPVSRTFLTKLALPPREGVRTGQFARTLVPGRTYAVTRIPEAAVIHRGQLEIVWIVNGGRAWMRIVKSGAADKGEIEVLAGLEDGERLIITGPRHIKDGDPVAIAP